jgi:hypothetical protein
MFFCFLLHVTNLLGDLLETIFVVGVLQLQLLENISGVQKLISD